MVVGEENLRLGLAKDIFVRLSGPVHTLPETFVNGELTLKMHQVFSVNTVPVILDLCLRKTGAGKSHDYHDAIVVLLVRFQNVFRSHLIVKAAFSNSSCLKSVFGKLRFRDGLVWTVGLTVEIKLRFRDGLVWTVGLTVEIKLRFRDGLVWTVGLTVEIKLRF